MMDAGDLTEGGRNRAADHEASDARHARSIARAEGLGEEEPALLPVDADESGAPRDAQPSRVVTADPATVHLAAMRDLAGRIIAMGNTIRVYETGQPKVDVIEMGRELAELVSHYEPGELSGPGSMDARSTEALDALSWARTALTDGEQVPFEDSRPYAEDPSFAHSGLSALECFAVGKLDEAINLLQGEEV